MQTEQEFRQSVVTEVLSWRGTPYHLNQCVKGAGVDCGRLLFGVYGFLGLTTEKTDLVSDDWFCHVGSEERYLFRILRHAKRVAETVAYVSTKADPGCIILLKTPNARVYNHAAIVTAWPRIVHAIHPVVEEVAVSRSTIWMNKAILILDPYPVYKEKFESA